MIRAYNDNMLEKAQVTLGAALDFAAHGMGYLPGDFMALFVESGLSRSFEQGSPAVLMGRSGVELALMVFEETVGLRRPARARRVQDYSVEFWAGWALAYYQWWSGLGFAQILEAVPMERVLEMHAPYHEMDVRRFAERMDELYAAANPHTALKRMRRMVGLTQEELARASGVSVRTIQQYEQRRKDVNKAQLETALALAQALGCRPEQLYERIAA